MLVLASCDQINRLHNRLAGLCILLNHLDLRQKTQSISVNIHRGAVWLPNVAIVLNMFQHEVEGFLKLVSVRPLARLAPRVQECHSTKPC